MEKDKAETKVWLVRAGSKDEAKSLFVDESTIALGPAEVGDLSQVGKTRDEFKTCYRAAFPTANPRGIGGKAGQLYRLIHEAKNGDYIFYPSKDGKVHIGTIQGKYQFSTAHKKRYPHRRKVRWIALISRDNCSYELLTEARAFKTFYGISKNADEVIRLSQVKTAKD